MASRRARLRGELAVAWSNAGRRTVRLGGQPSRTDLLAPEPQLGRLRRPSTDARSRGPVWYSGGARNAGVSANAAARHGLFQRPTAPHPPPQRASHPTTGRGAVRTTRGRRFGTRPRQLVSCHADGNPALRWIVARDGRRLRSHL